MSWLFPRSPVGECRRLRCVRSSLKLQGLASSKNCRVMKNISEASMRRSLQLLVTGALLFASPLFAQLNIPEIPYDSTVDFLKTTDDTLLGEVAGVATNSKGHVFVYTRTSSPMVALGG